MSADKRSVYDAYLWNMSPTDIALYAREAQAELTRLREENAKLYSDHATVSLEYHKLKREWETVNGENVFSVFAERNRLRALAERAGDIEGMAKVAYAHTQTISDWKKPDWQRTVAAALSAWLKGEK